MRKVSLEMHTKIQGTLRAALYKMLNHKILFLLPSKSRIDSSNKSLSVFSPF